MTKIQTLLSLYCLANFILVIHNSLVNSNGLKIRLIHPDSPESPFSQSNISREARIKRLVSQSNLRANYLAKTSSSIVGTQIDVQVFHYIVKIGIGTFKSIPPYKEYYLELDTGSSLVWIQCDGCTKCFKQTPKPFPKQNSSSFHPLLNENSPKQYEYEYEDGATTYGVLAQETFHLISNNGTLVKIPNIKFGCGLHNDMQYENIRNNKIAGIMGLGWEDLSFVKQLNPKINSKFSYCLPLLSVKTSNTYLAFGDDHKLHPKNSKTTPLYRINGTSPYYVDLQGISINKTKLNINPNVFTLNHPDSSGGCIIDSGTPYSRIITPAFEILKQELEKYFSKLKGFRKIRQKLGLELCYERSKIEGTDELPDITFHLRGSQADFVMKAEAVFEIVGRYRPIRFREYFCLAMVRNDMISIIGAHQQTNQRIIHDVKKKILVFYQEDCSKNP